MEPEQDNLTRFGAFTVTPGGSFLGTLRLDGQNSRLYLRNDKPFFLNLSADTKITGVLDDRTEVSIIGSWHPIDASSTLSPDGSVYFYDLSPDYVVVGSRNIAAQDENISSIQFVPEDWETLFWGSNPFGVVWDDKEVMRKLVKAHHPNQQQDLGKHVAVFYWTGKYEVFCCATSTGTVSGFHSIRTSGPTARGFRTDSEVCVKIEFDRPTSFNSAIRAIHRILMFFDYLAGRVQNHSGLAVTLDEEASQRYETHSCVAPRRDRAAARLDSSPNRSLINVAIDSGRFEQVLSKWMSRALGWTEARWNLLTGWKTPHRYDSDRIIRSANLFDLIPTNCFQQNTEVLDHQKTISPNTMSEIRKSPEGIDKQRVKTNRGRAGKYTLRQKILHRAEIVAREFGDEVSEIDLVCGEARNCRNRYVHGRSSKINLEEHPELFVFLVNTLEFVFVVSDLIDAGWRVSDWDRSHGYKSHPIGVYLLLYQDDLESLKTVLGK